MSRHPSLPLFAALLAGLAMSVGLAACGGAQIKADEVTAAPPELTIPTQGSGGADVLADPAATPGAGDSGSTSTDQTGTTGSTSTGGTSTPGGTSGTTSGGSGTGATSAPSGTTPSATATPQPQATAEPSNPGGSQAPSKSGGSTGGVTPGTDNFEKFCQQNPGAC